MRCIGALRKLNSKSPPVNRHFIIVTFFSCPKIIPSTLNYEKMAALTDGLFKLILNFNLYNIYHEKNTTYCFRNNVALQCL